jgi:RimJ/RimL family protein N-acetyltransferase
MSEIHTPRLRLRRARPDDLDALHTILSDERAMRHWSTAPHADLEQTRSWLADMIGAPPAQSDDFIVEHQGRVIGKAGCWRLPEVGFLLAPDVWGQGFGREAMSAVIDHIFAAHAVPALHADVDPNNAASLALLVRLGFRETGRAERTFKIGEAWYDSVYLSLARPAVSEA